MITLEEARKMKMKLTSVEKLVLTAIIIIGLLTIGGFALTGYLIWYAFQFAPAIPTGMIL